MRRRFLALFQKNRLDRELAEEIELHLDLFAEEKIRQGWSPDDARAAARREFGGVERTKEQYRDVRGLPFLESIAGDFVHAARIMRSNWFFTTAVAAILALSIGASTAVFTVAGTILLRPLRLPDPDRVVVIQSTNPREGKAFSVAEGVFTDWRDRAIGFESIAGAYPTSMLLSGRGQPREVSVVRTTAEFFSIAGLRPLEGRLFEVSAERRGADNLALLDEGFWLREFGGRRDVVGETVVLDSRVFRVVGVLPSTLFPFGRTDLWVPLAPRREVRSGGPVTVFARMRTGIARQAAQSEIDAIHAGIGQEHPQDAPFGVEIRPLHEWVAARSRPALLLLAGAVSLLMLMCCANIANLLLARGAARQREFAIRASLGGGRARLVRQVLTENLMLTALGGLAGWFVATALMHGLPHVRGFSLPRLNELQPDGHMLLINGAVTLASGLLFGLLPAWRAFGGNLAGLSTAATGVTPAKMRFRRALVAVQIGLSLVLLCGAGLLLNSFVRLTTIDVGFSKVNVVAAHVRLPYQRYDPDRTVTFYRRLMEEIRAMPGVQQVSAADYLPIQAVHFPYSLRVEGSPEIAAEARHVEPRYFEVLGIPLLAGREFEATDERRVPVPAVLNAEAARRLFQTERNALGKTITTNYRQTRLLEVVGVAGGARQLGLKQDPGLQVYLPFKFGNGKYAIARVAANSGDLAGPIAKAVFRLEPEAPAPDVSNVKTWFEREFATPRFFLLLIGAFAFAGLLIAAAGVYALVAFNVSRRTHEFGVRLALGATRRNLLLLVLAREAVPIAAGALLGITGALAATRLMASVLFGVGPDDASTFLAASLLLSLVALLACCLAARSAIRLAPAAALRHE